MSGSRKILGPEIVQRRLQMVTENNVWNYVDKINKQLAVNNIREDGSIDIVANFIMDDELFAKLKSMYLSAGWDRFEVSYTDPVDGYSGKTVVRVYPYPPQV